MKEGYWVIRTYVSGGRVGEKTKFWIPGEREATARGRRREQSEIKKQEQNEHSAVKSLARILNENVKAGDIILGLDYSDRGLLKLEAFCKRKGLSLREMSEAERMEALRDAAEHELVLCWRRVKRELEKDGITFKCYGAITSDMDGETGETVRVHHHLVINRESLEAFVKKWTLGGVNYKTLREQEDYTPIAEYFLCQVRKIPNAKKYITTRNIVRPAPKDRVAQSDAELRVPKGAKILYRNEFKPGNPQYIRYTLPKKGKSAGGLPDEETECEQEGG